MSQAIQANQTEREFWAAEGPQQYVEHGDRWETMARVTGALRDAFTPHAGAHGVVTDATAWLGTARR
jgi:hypothetical protein